jgi:UPF0755 protein
MTSRPLWPLFRTLILLISGFAILLACALAVFVLTTKSPNPALNPIESAILKVDLSRRSKDLDTPAGSDPRPVCFNVNQGDNAVTIGANLQQQGFVKDGDLFRKYARYYGIDSKLQAGIYSLKKTLTIREIANSLTNVGANTINFQVIEGKRIEEIADSIDRVNPPLAFRGNDFLALVGPSAALQSALVSDFATRAGIPKDHALEGFLFPDTYTLPACAPANELVKRMLNNFDARVTPQMRSDAQTQGLSLYQAVTLASIVEREAVVADERPIIASVYLNRLKIPMTLDADPTVQYAIANKRDPSTWWPQITSQDYQGVNDPYNTYKNRGLPPGPIASPGLSSIQAVTKPQTTPYLYFRASCNGDGRHKFAVTFQEQQANGCS